jgi:7,8-dihydro-6-hydroxymethylpterin-pyrophosphokinase
VLVPLNEIALQVVVPGCGKTVAQLFASLLEGSIDESDAVIRVQSEVWPDLG